MNESLETGTGLRSARRRAWWAAVISMVLFAPVAAAILGKAPTENRQVGGWLGLSVVLALSHVGVLWRLARRPDPVGGGLAVGTGWLSIFVIGMFFLTPIGRYSALMMLSVPFVGVSVLTYVVGLIAAQRVLILAGGRIQRTAAEGREARRAEGAVMAPVVSALLWAALLLGSVVVKHVGERQQKMTHERMRAVERAATHPVPPPLERLWKVELLPGARRTPTTPSRPVLGPDGTVYVALDAALVAVAPSGEVKWRNTAVQTMSVPAAVARDGTIYVGGRNGTLYAARPDGTLQWAVSIAAPSRTFVALPRPAVGVDGTIYVGVTLRGHDRPKNSPLTAVAPDGTVRWQVEMGRGLNDAIIPTAEGGVYVVGNGDISEILARVDANGTIRFRRELPPGWSGPHGPVAARDGTIYIAHQGEVLAVRPSDSTITRIGTGDSYMNALLVADDGTLFTATRKTIVARGSDGRERWTHDIARLSDDETVNGFELGSDRRLIVSTAYRVVMLDANDGSELAEYAPTSDRGNRSPSHGLHWSSRPAVSAEGTIYVVDAYYRLHALRPK
jgi:outer membrane protein assembly factor BamB